MRIRRRRGERMERGQRGNAVGDVPGSAESVCGSDELKIRLWGRLHEIAGRAVAPTDSMEVTPTSGKVRRQERGRRQRCGH